MASPIDNSGGWTASIVNGPLTRVILVIDFGLIDELCPLGVGGYAGVDLVHFGAPGGACFGSSHLRWSATVIDFLPSRFCFRASLERRSLRSFSGTCLRAALAAASLASRTGSCLAKMGSRLVFCAMLLSVMCGTVYAAIWQAAQSAGRFLPDAAWSGLLWSPAWLCCLRPSAWTNGEAAWLFRRITSCASNVRCESEPGKGAPTGRGSVRSGDTQHSSRRRETPPERQTLARNLTVPGTCTR